MGVPDALAEDADCGLLLDVNNVFVSSFNHDFDPAEYVRNVPHRRVVQFHLAGHTDCGTHRIDTHDGEVIDPVWELYRQAHRLTGGASTLLEWDAKIPEFPVVHAEVLKAKEYMGARLAPAVGRRGRPPRRRRRARPCPTRCRFSSRGRRPIPARPWGETILGEPPLLCPGGMNPPARLRCAHPNFRRSAAMNARSPLRTAISAGFTHCVTCSRCSCCCCA